MYFDGANNKSRVHAVYSTGLIEVSIDRGDLGYSYMYQIEGGKLSDCRKNAMAATGVRPNSLGPKPGFMGAETVAGTAVQHWRMAPTQYNPTQLQVWVNLRPTHAIRLPPARAASAPHCRVVAYQAAR